MKFNTLFRKKLTQSLKYKSTGSIAEEIACQYLQQQKLTLVIQNYHCQRGEIDIIMRDKDTLVFIEVKYRANNRHGTPIEAIHYHKLQKIKSTIEHYIMTNNLGYIPCRIDVIGLHGNLQQPDINWVKNIVID
ncbi:MAG: YraN family protein [Arenicella sp.]